VSVGGSRLIIKRLQPEIEKKEREKVKKILQNERNPYLCNPNEKAGSEKRGRG
jgi:hypothetical protein